MNTLVKKQNCSIYIYFEVFNSSPKLETLNEKTNSFELQIISKNNKLYARLSNELITN